MIAERQLEMSTIQVLLFATLLRYQPQARHGQPFELSFSEGDTLRDVLAVLDLPEYVVRHLFVNGERAALDYHPRDGDEVAIFPPIAGG